MSAGDDWYEPQADVEPGQPLAGIGTRLVAFILNIVTLLGPFLVAVTAVDEDAPSGSTRDALLGLVAFGWLFVIAVLNIVLLAQRGQSLGKIVVGIRIVRTDGTPADVVHVVLLRAVANLGLSLVPVYWFVDSLFILRADRRCIHDLLADTKVVVA